MVHLAGAPLCPFFTSITKVASDPRELYKEQHSHIMFNRISSFYPHISIDWCYGTLRIPAKTTVPSNNAGDGSSYQKGI